jgi:hypothetical protein
LLINKLYKKKVWGVPRLQPVAAAAAAAAAVVQVADINKVRLLTIISLQSLL